jgi:hypothetical protein
MIRLVATKEQIREKGLWQLVSINPENDAIRHWKTWLANYQFDAEYLPTTFNFSSNWMQGICSKDKKAGTAILNGSIHAGARATGTRISEDYYTNTKFVYS